MTTQTAIVLPLLIIIILSLLVGIAFLTSQIFYEHEYGIDFLIALQKGSTFNGYDGTAGRVTLEKHKKLTGTEYTASVLSGKDVGKTFCLYKANRIIFGSIEELVSD